MKIRLSWKRIVLASLVVLTLLAIVVAVGPYLAVAAIRDSLANRDAQALSEKIDFPTLRLNLKQQLQARNAESNAKDQLQSMRNLGSLFALSFIESELNPDGLARMLSGPNASGEFTPKEEFASFVHKLFEHARYEYDSATTFSVYLMEQGGSKDDTIRLILRRQGISWKLCNISGADDSEPQADVNRGG